MKEKWERCPSSVRGGEGVGSKVNVESAMQSLGTLSL